MRPSLRGGVTCVLLLLAALARAGDAPPAVPDPAKHAAGGVTPPTAGATPSAPARGSQGTGYQLVRRFDFNERPLGNFDPEPMHWQRLSGPGLPVFAQGRLDERVGRLAPPSFRLEIRTGNVAYRYEHPDLLVIPESDYVVSGWLRTEGLEHAVAFLSTHLVDRFGEPIAGSARVSAYQPERAGDSDWRRVEIAIPGEFPTAWAMRLECWILQNHVWREDARSGVDPIVPEESGGRAWIDDLEVYRLPRTRMALESPSGLIAAGRPGALIIEANNATSEPLSGQLEIIDRHGAVVLTQPLHIPGSSSPQTMPPDEHLAGGGHEADRSNRDEHAAQHDSAPDASAAGVMHVELTRKETRLPTQARIALPPLPAEVYEARLRMTGGDDTLMARSVRFAVLPDLPPLDGRTTDLGVDIGRWWSASLPGLLELVDELGCGAVKIGVPVGLELVAGGEPGETHAEISELVRRLAVQRVESTGVLTTVGVGEARPVRLADVAAGGDVTDLLSPIFAHYGGLVPNWQLGDDRSELSGLLPWTAGGVERVRSVLQRFVTFPELVIPQALAVEGPIAGAARSIVVPAEAPTRDLAPALATLADESPTPRWLQLDHPQRTHWTDAELAELVRRVALAKALPAGRVYVPAPFELSDSGGAPAWAPSDAFVVLRNVFRRLAGKQVSAVMRPAEGVLALLFEGTASSCVVLWSWRAGGSPPEIELYLGPDPVATDMWGRPVALERVGERGLLRPTSEPIFIDSLHLPLALLQASFRLQPVDLEVHQLANGPVVSFLNPFDRPLSGRAVVRPPSGWSVEPREWEFTLDPDQTEQRELRLTLPARELARGHELTVQLEIFAPEKASLSFPVQMTVGLRDIELATTPYFDGDKLVVEMTLRNQSDRSVSFNAFCELPGRPRLETVFLDVAGGETGTRLFVIPDAEALRGAVLDTGVAELAGRRRLDQVVRVPD